VLFLALCHTVREQEIFAKGESRKAATMAALPGTEDIELKRTAPGKYSVTDPQGFTANVVGKPVHPDDNKTIIPIDRVLLGSKCGVARMVARRLVLTWVALIERYNPKPSCLVLSGIHALGLCWGLGAREGGVRLGYCYCYCYMVQDRA